MQWPEEVIAAFKRGLKIVPAEGYNPDQVLQALLDETARRAVWRTQGDKAKIRGALCWPYTPLGSVVACFVDHRAEQLMLDGPRWGKAVDLLNDYMEQHVDTIFEYFEDEAEPYNDLNLR